MLSAYYEWEVLILEPGEEDDSWEVIMERRKHTCVLWPPTAADQMAYELVNDGSTCLFDAKIWTGAYKHTHTLAAWKSEVHCHVCVCPV